MIVIHVSVQVKESARHEFERLLRDVVEAARIMAGCNQYEWYRFPDSPLEFAIFGEFDSKETFENYLSSAVVKRIGEELIPRLDAPPTFKHYEAKVFESA